MSTNHLPCSKNPKPSSDNSIVKFANRIILIIFAPVIQILGEFPVAIKYYGNTNEG